MLCWLWAILQRSSTRPSSRALPSSFKPGEWAFCRSTGRILQKACWQADVLTLWGCFWSIGGESPKVHPVGRRCQQAGWSWCSSFGKKLPLTPQWQLLKKTDSEVIVEQLGLSKNDSHVPGEWNRLRESNRRWRKPQQQLVRGEPTPCYQEAVGWQGAKKACQQKEFQSKHELSPVRGLALMWALAQGPAKGLALLTWAAGKAFHKGFLGRGPPKGPNGWLKALQKGLYLVEHSAQTFWCKPCKRALWHAI